MNKPENSGQFNAGITEGLRKQCQLIMEVENKTMADLAREADIAYGTFSGWMGGTYAGRVDNVSKKVDRWIASREQKKQASMSVPRAPGYIETPSAQAFTQTLRFAQVLPDMALIVGAPGIGKTVAARAYQSANPNVIYVAAHPSASSANTILGTLADELNIAEKSAVRLFKTVAKAVERSGYLIIIDEAQHLKMDALEQLRALHDGYDVGLAFVGNESVHSRVTSGRNEGAFAQLFSRFGYRIVQKSARAQDIEALLAAWGVTDPESIKLCRVIAKRAGALRVMTKVLQLAAVTASGDVSGVTADHINAAYSQLTTGGGKL